VCVLKACVCVCVCIKCVCVWWSGVCLAGCVWRGLAVMHRNRRMGEESVQQQACGRGEHAGPVGDAAPERQGKHPRPCIQCQVTHLWPCNSTNEQAAAAAAAAAPIWYASSQDIRITSPVTSPAASPAAAATGGYPACSGPSAGGPYRCGPGPCSWARTRSIWA
jgi:hypothetical protein